MTEPSDTASEGGELRDDLERAIADIVRGLCPAGCFPTRGQERKMSVLAQIVRDRRLLLAANERLEQQLASAVEAAQPLWSGKVARLEARAASLSLALVGAPILSKYHGAQGFEVERFIADYERWKASCRALAPTPSPPEGGVEQDHIVSQEAVRQEQVSCPDRACDLERLAYLFDTGNGCNGQPRIIDLCFSSFMLAKVPNSEDGGPSDWFTDTKPAIDKLIAEMLSGLTGDPTPVAASVSAAPDRPERSVGWPCKTPRFGDMVENGWASERNPTRHGYFVRSFKRTGRMNAGLTWEITDRRGKFWEFSPREIGERLTVTRAVSAAPPQSEVPSGWQPIETAPKDGTVVDLFGPWGRQPDCYWGKPEHSCGEAGQYCDDDWHGADPDWVDQTLNYFLGRSSQPTHWRLPPAPPAPSDGAERRDHLALSERLNLCKTPPSEMRG